MPLAEYDGDGVLRTTFLYGGRWTPVAFVRGGITYHVVTDHLDSPRLVVDANGAVVKRVDYDAFGNVVLDTAPALDLPFGFAGGMADPDHDLIRFGLRDYQPSTARWTAKDPIVLAGGWNLYGYLANDPLNGTDRDGLRKQSGGRRDGPLDLATRWMSGLADQIDQEIRSHQMDLKYRTAFVLRRGVENFKKARRSPGGLGGTREEPASACENGTCTLDFGDSVLTDIPEDFANFVETNGNGG